MSANFGVVYPLWSFDNDSDSRLDRLVGEVGINHITIPVVTGPVVDFHAAPSHGPHHFETAGGWHYQPNRDHYHANEIKPKSAEWVRSRNPLPQLCDLARKRDLRVYFRVDLPAAFHITHGHDSCAIRNMWDEPVPIAGPCPLHPDFRALFRGTVADLRDYTPDGLQIFIDLQPDYRWAPARPNRGEQKAGTSCFDLCFCATCREAAFAGDINVDDVVESARMQSLRELRAIREDAAVDERRINDFGTFRTDVMRKWFASLRETFSEQAAFHIRRVSADDELDPALPGWQSLVLSDRQARRSSDSPLEREFAGREAISISAWRPAFRESSTLVRFVNSAVAAGTTFFDFERMDAAPNEVVDWLKQAVRFARRTGDT